MTERKRNLPQTTTHHAVPNNAVSANSPDLETAPFINAFSVDVEDYYHVSAFDQVISRKQWPGYKSRVVRSTHRLLEILAGRSVTATFYVLGYVAEQHPQLVNDIAAAGHEIGCHSYWHRRVNELSREEFRADTIRCKTLLENLTGQAVTNYRAPSFSITSEARWAWNVLAELGFNIDSSLCPARHGHVAPLGPHQITTDAGTIWQLPISAKPYGRFQLPISGGGYFRLFSLNWSIRQLRHVNASGRPFVFYIHPWEVDDEQPRMRAGKLRSRIRHYVGLHNTAFKLEQLLDAFQFSTMKSLVESAQVEAAA